MLSTKSDLEVKLEKLKRLSILYRNGIPEKCGDCIVLCRVCHVMEGDKYYPDPINDNCRACYEEIPHFKMWCWFVKRAVDQRDKPICDKIQLLKEVLERI